MKLFSTFDTAISALAANKGRTVLTSLGITIGIAAVISMVAAGRGAKSYIDASFGSIGPNLVVAFSGTSSSSGVRIGTSASFSRKDAEVIRKRLAPWISGCSEITQYGTIAKTPTGQMGTTFAGGVPEIFRIRRWKLKAGRFYSDDDVRGRSTVVVIGSDVAKELFPNVRPDDVIGETIRAGAGGLRFTVIGVLAPKGSTLVGPQDNLLMVPITTLLKRVMGKDKCSLIMVEARSVGLVDKVKTEMVKVLDIEHRIRAGEEPDFNVKTMREYADLAVLLANTLNGLIYAIASVSLIVGGIGVMNIMLVSVTERTREIGIRMAVGAKTKDILGQFLAESVILALIGGGVGITLGAGCAWLIAHLAEWELVVSPASVLLAVATSAAVGIFFGYYPARKASLLDPIEALRYE